MTQLKRREFIKTSTLAGLAFTMPLFSFEKYTPLLSFSTLGCPDWSFETILNFAVNNGYDGIEIRGIQRELNLLKCNEFSSEENIAFTRKLVEDKKIKIVGLGSSAAMHHADPAERKKSLDDAKNFIHLAQQLNCPYVRVFPNNFPKGQDRNKTMDLIITALQELGDFAKNTGVTVLMETHGDLVQSEEIAKLMNAVNRSNVGLVWDVVNMWSVSKESPTQVYARLKKYIRHTHIKDLVFANGKQEYVLLGKGTTPVFEAINLLAKDKYKGYLSFEWEKLWHPEIAEPEIAIANYAKVMKEHFKR
ncbi:MAG TPA: sugar phosphate isomerase/epimerase family protein [Hanamia sp.]|nr:sugar phosphate isomerase/epimerase family protein [Hanamia sp.]